MQNQHPDIHELFQLYDTDILLSYKGPFDKLILFTLGTYIEQILEAEIATAKKLFKIFIELAQNIAYYSAETDGYTKGESVGIGSLVIGRYEKYYNFVTGNVIDNQQVTPLVEKCKTINLLSRDKLREYKRLQRSQPRGDRGSAHIGLIQVALYSGKPLDVQVTQIDDKKSFLAIGVKIQK